MCLACEMDALWFAEMEAAVRASSPLPAGERSSASVGETAGEGLSDHGQGESPSPAPTFPPPQAGEGREGATSPQRGEVKAPFICEETRSQ